MILQQWNLNGEQNIFQGNGYTSVSAIMKDLGWEADRTKRVLVSYKL